MGAILILKKEILITINKIISLDSYHKMEYNHLEYIGIRGINNVELLRT
ncbi:hypothetical protein TEMA_05080 [Terrisporobacter mayombei]|uniref:Uncharacterized protein n=1 Tax=Terrisporobacter mayombei TaxID=1541 RepID=A0ABY9PWX0_9FIRM|nr:hypothetical protein TEMA_05080 [Terrisporobacter mayombei]